MNLWDLIMGTNWLASWPADYRSVLGTNYPLGSDTSPGTKSNPGLNKVRDCHSSKSVGLPTVGKPIDAQADVMRNERDMGELRSNGTPK